MLYTLIAYTASSTNMCRGHVMNSYDSSFSVERSLTEEELIKRWAHYRTEGADEIEVIGEVTQEDVLTERIGNGVEKLTKELEEAKHQKQEEEKKKEREERVSRAEEQERRELERLKVKYEGSK